MLLNPIYLHRVCSMPMSLFNASYIANKMFKVMHSYNGVGLAANQVGLLYRMFVMESHPKKYVCILPEVVDKATETTILNERCLSIPNVSVPVERANWIIAKWIDENGLQQEEKLEGVIARCFLHELDHLNGITILEREINEQLTK